MIQIYLKSFAPGTPLRANKLIAAALLVFTTADAMPDAVTGLDRLSCTLTDLGLQKFHMGPFVTFYCRFPIYRSEANRCVMRQLGVQVRLWALMLML